MTSYHKQFRDILNAGDLQTATKPTQGTRPATWPSIASAPLDHVLSSEETFDVISNETWDLDGTDHEAVNTKLAWK